MDPATERSTALADLAAAITSVIPVLNLSLIPPEGISCGYALRGARDKTMIAAVDGGIISVPGGLPRAGPCVFGKEDPVVRIILTAMKFDPLMRSAALLQYSGRAIRVFERDLFLECAVADTAPKNQGISTMDWEIASCCRDGVPDVIVRKGTGDADSRIIIFGERPADVANNIIICSNRI